MIISGRGVLTLKPSPILRKMLNQGIQYPEASEIQEQGCNPGHDPDKTELGG